MKQIDLLTALQKFKATDEVRIIVEGQETDIEAVERQKTDNVKFLQHKALIITTK